VASNLALLFASFSRKVLLVDADLRKPSISRAFQCDTHYGLRDIIRGSVWNDDFVLKTSVPNLSVLPAGLLKENTSNGIDAAKMPPLIADMAKHYDVVIFDTPPVLALADVCVLAASTDVTLLVVRSRMSTIQSIERGAGILYSMNVKSLLAVVNNVDESDARGETYYYAQYGYAVNKEPGCENIINDPVTIHLESNEDSRKALPSIPVEQLPIPQRLTPVVLTTVRNANSVSGRYRGAEKGPGSTLHLESPEVSFEITEAEAPCAVGSGKDCHICIDHPDVADRHAEFIFHGGAWLVRDADSGYPTYVNGRAAHSVIQLKSGDVIELGKLRLTARVAVLALAPRFGNGNHDDSARDAKSLQMPGETA
jgi:capsular exopolysaccharide synthesis family protein